MRRYSESCESSFQIHDASSSRRTSSIATFPTRWVVLPAQSTATPSTESGFPALAIRALVRRPR